MGGASTRLVAFIACTQLTAMCHVPMQCLIAAAKGNKDDLDRVVMLNTRLVALCTNFDSIEVRALWVVGGWWLGVESSWDRPSGTGAVRGS